MGGRRIVVCAFVIVGALGAPARADGSRTPWLDLTPPAPTSGKIIGFRVEGSSKVTPRTLSYLARVRVGDPISIGPDVIKELEAALMSSELFESAAVRLEATQEGIVVVARLDDKLSWIAAPAVFILPNNWSVGVGYAENDLFGEDKKLLLYGQLGNRSTLFFGTYLDPSVRGTPLQLRFDLYAYKIIRSEYLNPPDNPRSFEVARESAETFLDAGALVGWTFYWWLVGDLRLRGARVSFSGTHANDAAQTPLPSPEANGWDITSQVRLTADHRRHIFGVTSGAYAQVVGEASVPGLDTYGYQLALLRAYYSWQLFGEHELELRSYFSAGRHLPFHEELSNGGESDLRGYDGDQFRGDVQVTARAEYSIPLAKWKIFAFRALGFWDGGYVGYHFQDPSGMRDYLPTERNGAYWVRNDVGAGFRVYLKSVVLPLLGFDLGYGIEGHSPEIYFELGLTDF